MRRKRKALSSVMLAWAPALCRSPSRVAGSSSAERNRRCGNLQRLGFMSRIECVFTASESPTRDEITTALKWDEAVEETLSAHLEFAL